MFGHWLLNSSVLDVPLMAYQMNEDCLLQIGTMSALNQVHHIISSTVCGGFCAKSCSSCRAVKHSTHSYTGSCFTVWMVTRTFPLYVSLCCLNATLTRRSLRLGGQQYATKWRFESASPKWGDISTMH